MAKECKVSFEKLIEEILKDDPSAASRLDELKYMHIEKENKAKENKGFIPGQKKEAKPLRGEKIKWSIFIISLIETEQMLFCF